MLPPRPATPVITIKRVSIRRTLFTAAAAVFVMGGLVSLALDDEPVSFVMPEPPPGPSPVQQLPKDASDGAPERDRELDHAFANLFAELNEPR